MAIDVVIPDLGEIVTGVRVVQWVKRVGDAVSEGDDLVEITTDKIDLMLPSPATGVVATILVEAGDRAPIGAVLCTVA